MQANDDQTLISGCRAGNLHACELLVQRYQPELARTAFLLTGDAETARELTRVTWTQAAARLAPGRQDARIWLLGLLGQSYLTDTLQPSISKRQLTSKSARYQEAETRRDRTRSALAQLTPEIRLAVVLSEFNQVPDSDLDQIVINAEHPPLSTSLASQRQRIHQMLSLGLNEPLRRTLADASIDAARDDIWPGLADEFAAQHSQRRTRNRVILAGTGAFVVLLVAGFIALLVSSNATEKQTQAQGFVPHLDPPSVWQQTTGLPPEIFTTNSARQPLPSLPDEILAMQAGQMLHSGVQVQSQEEVGGLGPPIISADGKQLVTVRVDTSEATLRATIGTTPIASEGATWSTEIVHQPDLTPPQLAAFSIDAAVTSNRVYVAHRAWQLDEPIQIVALDRADGHILDHWSIPLLGPITGTLGLYAAADETELYLMVLGQWPENTGRIDYFRLRLPDLKVIKRVQPLGGTPEPNFFFWSADPLADGSGLYDVLTDGNTPRIIVQFFDFKSAAIRELAVPFSASGRTSRIPFETLASSDGTALYLLAPTRKEIAIVNLQQREVRQIIPLDVATPLPDQQPVAASNKPILPGRQLMQLSLDGRWLFTAASATRDGTPVASGIWIIDTQTWTITGQRLAGQAVDGLLLAQGQIIVSMPEAMLGFDADAFRDQEDLAGDLIDGDAATSLSAIYLSEYGHYPKIAGTAPQPIKTVSTLPRLAVSASDDQIKPGEPVTIDLRFISPTTGQIVEDADQTIRYTPPKSLTIQLESERDETILLIPGQVDIADYRGQVTLTTPGSWSLEIQSDLDYASRTIPNFITVLGPVRQDVPLSNAGPADMPAF